MRVGVKILDDAKFRKLLDERFEQFGYALANSDVDEQLYCAHFSHLTPRGRGRAYLLKFTRLSDGDWNAATLLDASNNKVLDRSVLDPSTFLGSGQEMERDGDQACFWWVEQILIMCIGKIESDQCSS